LHCFSRSIQPQDFYLFPNYPNPFNSSTIIEFAVGNEEKVSIEIFDLLGRKIDTLVDARLSPGRYKISWSAEGLASGVYFCRMRAGKFISTIKVLLIK